MESKGKGKQSACWCDQACKQSELAFSHESNSYARCCVNPVGRECQWITIDIYYTTWAVVLISWASIEPEENALCEFPEGHTPKIAQL